MAVLAVFLSYLIGMLIRLDVAWQAWWAVIGLAVMATFALAGALNVVMLRPGLIIEVGPDGFRAGDAKIQRESVVAVRRYKDLRFKGVLIDLVDGQSLRVPAHVHHPVDVLKAFRRHGYPVEG
jgi:hypothetical protein